MFRGLTALAVIFFMSSPALAQTEPRNTPTTEVVVQALPRAKPAEEAPLPPLEWFTQTQRVEHIALSDDGSRFAYVTTKEGVRLLTTYNVTNGSSQTIKLGDDPLTAVTWLSNDYILLSETKTGLRSICPDKEKNTLASAQAARAYSIQAAGSFDMSTGEMADTLGGLIREMALSTPRCVDYGLRSHDAGSVINLRTQTVTPIGNRMSGDYYGMAYGLPKAITVDGKTQLTGAFLELRDEPLGGQLAQRVYLWRFDPDTGRGNIVNDGGGDLDRLGRYVDDWLLDAEGTPVARAHYTYIGRAFHIEVRKEGGGWKSIFTRKLEKKADLFAPVLAGFGRDGESLLIADATIDAYGEKRFHYYELALDGTLSEPLSPTDATRERPIFDPETRALAGFVREGETPVYTFFDPGLAEYYQHAINTESGKTVRVEAIAHNPAQMILHVQGGDDVGNWYYYDFSAGKRIDIGSQYPSVPAEWAASQRTVRYKASDGLEIRAIMTLPSQGEAKNRPAVVLAHDGPLGHDARGYDWLAQVLASRGYVVLQPNYRGSDNHDLAFTEAGYGEWSGRMISDLSDGVAYLAAEGIIDPSRVCIAGRGYGGYAALASVASAKAGTYRCAISLNGISDPADYLKDAENRAVADAIAPIKADPHHDRNILADPRSPTLIRRFFGAQTPAAITASDIERPVLLVHVEHNRTVPIAQSISLNSQLQRAGKSVTYTQLSDCHHDHDLNTPACRLTTAQAVTQFLEKHNPAK